MQRSTLGSFSAVLVALLLVACGGGSQSGGSTPPPPSGNRTPTANSGTNQTVTPGVIVTLNGSGSSDPDGSVASFAWTQTAGTMVTLSSATVSQPTFTAPSTVSATTLTFSLIVTDNLGAASTASTVNIIVNPAASGNVAGRIRFMRIPTTTANGLNFSAAQLQPARGVLVRAVNATSQAVLATSNTDAMGNYAMTIAGNTNINLVIVAQMQSGSSQSFPRWDFRAEDLDANPVPYTYTDGQTFSSSASTAHDVDIPSGLSSSGAVTGTRASAPFAVLDTVYQAVQLVLSVAPNTDFPPLILDWATSNPGSQTFFTTTDDNGAPLQHIVLSADVDEDTDEFDQHVIAHEFGHYIEFNFSRADNIGGSHGLGDRLDIRTAFGEGFGYAFGAIVLNDPVTRDTFVNNGTQLTSTFNVQDNPPAPGDPTGCWCSESSVWSILWDEFDSDAESGDSVALGFQPMWNVLIGSEKTTHAFTSIFSFTDALKRANPGSSGAIDALLAAQNISAVQDAYGTGETHTPSPVSASAALPVYTDITVGGGPKVLLNVNDAGTYNTLGNHRFLKFTLATARTITITVNTSNPDAQADPDVLVFRNGVFLTSGENAPPQPEVKQITNAAAGDYLLDVYDCANGCSSEQGTSGDYNITVTVN
jgi:PKD domain